MARVLPFVGTRYNPCAVEDLTDVMAPPYDVIDAEQQTALHARHPSNIVRLILGKDQVGDDEYNNRYHRAASLLTEWKSKGTLINDPCKSFYIYQQRFRDPDGKWRERTGFFAAILLEDPEKGMIRPHEETFEAPTADRLKLLRMTACNLSAVFCLYADPQRAAEQLLQSVIDSGPPRTELTDSQGVEHRLWLMSDPPRIKQLSALMQDRELFIADGHHRYETAVRYRDEMNCAAARNKGEHPPYTYALACLTSWESEGLEILPTHRVLSAELGEGVEHDEVLEDLSGPFDVRRVQMSSGKKANSNGAHVCSEIAKLAGKTTAFAMVLPGGKAYVLELKPDADVMREMRAGIPKLIGQLDVTVLHEYIIPNVWVGNPEMDLDDQDVFYVKDAGEALDMLRAPRYASAVFLMNPLRKDTLREICAKRLRVPHKSTYFYPKIINGMVLRDHSAPW